MSTNLENLTTRLLEALGAAVTHHAVRLGELTLVVRPEDWRAVAQRLRDEFQFEQLIDLCGLDYSTYAGWSGPRFAVVAHLLSVSRNLRLRVRVFAPDEAFPVVDSLMTVWSAANWYEREAFDLFGIVFDGHSDLRRLLTDYGFVGHPFRKDFPISGHVEMRYDEQLKRVVYEPVSIAPREVIPRRLRPENYGDTEQHHG